MADEIEELEQIRKKVSDLIGKSDLSTATKTAFQKVLVSVSRDLEEAKKRNTQAA